MPQVPLLILVLSVSLKSLTGSEQLSPGFQTTCTQKALSLPICLPKILYRSFEENCVAEEFETCCWTVSQNQR